MEIDLDEHGDEYQKRWLSKEMTVIRRVMVMTVMVMLALVLVMVMVLIMMVNACRRLLSKERRVTRKTRKLKMPKPEEEQPPP